jgi:hypothetical protein
LMTSGGMKKEYNRKKAEKVAEVDAFRSFF